ncbi:MAG: trypsin-like peptidase domain-containing protein [Lachnospiraceae bacterium]|nr:trypsin-like peptidase domain-containing protein [Lachnospiraceae bacterium]
MLTLVGADVLLLQSKADIALSASLKELSSELVLGSYGDVEIPAFSPAFSTEEAQQPAIAVNTMYQPAESGVGSNSGSIRMVIPERPAKKQTQPNAAALQNSPLLSAAVSVQMPPHASQKAPRPEKSFEQLALLASSVVMITIHDSTGKPIGSGSGIMIGRKGYILTNSHVACGGKFYTVKIEDDENSYRTDEMIKYNQVLDLAMIRIDRSLNPLPVYKGAQKLVRGQKVVAIGSPLGLFNSVSDGIISGFRSIDHVDMIQFTAPISHGSSGGAVLNMYGEVIGISTAGFDDGQNINLAVGYEFINMFIKGFE